VTEQGLVVRVPGQAGVWVEARARAEAEWVARLQQDRAEVVSVRNAEQRLDMLPESLVMQKAVRSVERE